MPISIVEESDPVTYAVWTDTWNNDLSGRCLATGTDKLETLKEALSALESDICELRDLIAKEDGK